MPLFSGKSPGSRRDFFRGGWLPSGAFWWNSAPPAMRCYTHLATALPRPRTLVCRTFLHLPKWRRSKCRRKCCPADERSPGSSPPQTDAAPQTDAGPRLDPHPPRRRTQPRKQFEAEFPEHDDAVYERFGGDIEAINRLREHAASLQFKKSRGFLEQNALELLDLGLEPGSELGALLFKAAQVQVVAGIGKRSGVSSGGFFWRPIAGRREVGSGARPTFRSEIGVRSVLIWTPTHSNRSVLCVPHATTREGGRAHTWHATRVLVRLGRDIGAAHVTAMLEPHDAGVCEPGSALYHVADRGMSVSRTPEKMRVTSCLRRRVRHLTPPAIAKHPRFQ